jgi:hypothetical protein
MTKTHKNRLPKGWMGSDKIFFLPANYTFGASRIHYVPETAANTILATAKALMDMRTELDANGSGNCRRQHTASAFPPA